MPDVRFTTVLRGYDPEQVHELIRLANRTLASPDPDERAAVERQLRQPRLHVRLRGYDRAQVHDRLAALADQLSTR